jgi:hypothetical protein
MDLTAPKTTSCGHTKKVCKSVHALDIKSGTKQIYE